MLTIVLPIYALGAPPTHGRPSRPTQVIIEIDLSERQLHVEKRTGGRRQELAGPILAVNAPSMRTGRFRPTRLYQRFKTVSGNTYLENVIFFDGARAIRTTRLFDRLQRQDQRITGGIVLEPDFGSLLYDTVERYGPKNTTVVVRN